MRMNSSDAIKKNSDAGDSSGFAARYAVEHEVGVLAEHAAEHHAHGRLVGGEELGRPHERDHLVGGASEHHVDVRARTFADRVDRMFRQARAEGGTEPGARRREATAGDRERRPHEHVGVELLERLDVGADAELLEHGVGCRRAPRRGVRASTSAPLIANALWNRPCAAGMPEQAGDLAATAGLAEDRHVPTVAAERRDVVAHPLERGDDVEHPDVAGVGELVAEVRQVEEARARRAGGSRRRRRHRCCAPGW